MQNDNSSSSGILNAKDMEIVALIPVKGKDWKINGKLQMSFTIDSALKSKYISRVIVTTNNVETAELAKSLGAECPFIRSDNLTMNYISLDTVLKDALLHMEESGVFPALIVKLEETFPFRERELIDKMIALGFWFFKHDYWEVSAFR